MKTKNIHLEFRNPRNKKEAEYFGITYSEPTHADIFINTRKNRNGSDLIDTFFHELTHVFLHFFKHTKISAQREEQLARQVGRVCLGVLKR